MIDLIAEDNPVLHRAAESFDFDNPIIDPKELFFSMKDVMIKNKGIGLAAPQVGISTRMFIMGNPMEPDLIFSVFNPSVLETSNDEEYWEEGCLSYPGLFVKVKRPKIIRVRYTTWENVTDTIKFEGVSARVFLHEYDHLDGITYHQRANKLHLDKAYNKRKMFIRKKRDELSAI